MPCRKARGRNASKYTEEMEDADLLKDGMEVQGHRLSQQPAVIKHGIMRDYQMQGLNWLIHLYDNGINGILADEMVSCAPSIACMHHICITHKSENVCGEQFEAHYVARDCCRLPLPLKCCGRHAMETVSQGLGKTLQTISLLGYLHEYRGIHGPHMVIVPKSTLHNWINEFRKWCPIIRAVKFHGTQEERVSTRRPAQRQARLSAVLRAATLPAASSAQHVRDTA